jgi:hypothetical protein
MIPRTVQMAKEVASSLTPTQLSNFGNIIAAPYRGWTNNYQEYYTQLQPNGYGVNPGDPTMFNYSVHSFSQQAGGIATFKSIQGGKNYTPGTYLAEPLSGGSGTGATANIVVTASPPVTKGPATGASFYSAGSGYPVNPVFFSGQASVAVTGKGLGLRLDGKSDNYQLENIYGVFEGGEGYEVGDIVQVLPGSGTALVDAVGYGGIVTSITIVDPGLGYKVNDSITAFGLPDGSGFYASVATIISGGVAGAITATGTLVPGSGYTPGTYPATPLTGGTGTGATGTLVVAAGGATGPITSLGNLVGGTGYAAGTYLNVPLTGGTGTGAKANIIVTQAGGVTAVSIVTPGSDYAFSGTAFNFATQAITGTGTGLRVNYNYFTNALTSITAIVSGGSGYVVGDTVNVSNTAGATYTAGNGVIRVDAYTPPSPGTVTTAVLLAGSTGYTLGDVLTATLPGGGTGWNITVTGISGGGGGAVTSFTLDNPGSGYTVGDTLTAALPAGAGWSVPVTAVSAVIPVTPYGEPFWAQAPRRFSQTQVAPFTPPTANQQAIAYSFIYPVSDSGTEPPISFL